MRMLYRVNGARKMKLIHTVHPIMFHVSPWLRSTKIGKLKSSIKVNVSPSPMTAPHTSGSLLVRL